MSYEPFRRQHHLTENKAVSFPNQAVFFDCESRTIPGANGRDELVLKLGWACYLRKDDQTHRYTPQWRKITDPGDFWDWIERLPTGKGSLYVFAHNVYVDFSWLHGYSELLERGWRPKKPYIKGWCFIATWRKPTPQYQAHLDSGSDKTFKGKRRWQKYIHLLDTGNYWHLSLEALAEGLGMKRTEVDYDTATDSELSEACRNHVQVTMEAVKMLWAFIEKHDLGGFAKTTPSQAFRAFRHRFKDTRIWLHDDPRLVRLERLAYHGGRTEARFKGKLTHGPYYKLDITSAYPHVMRTHPFPCNNNRYMKNPTVSQLRHYLDGWCVIATCKLDTDEAVYAHKMGKTLTFPTGTFTETLTTRELIYALEHDHIAKVLEMGVFYQGDLFSKYVNFFFSLRQTYKSEGNEAFASLCKLFLNGFSGKWGQLGTVREELGECPIDEAKSVWSSDAQTGEIFLSIHYGGKIYREKKMGESFNSFPAIIAHITADVRLMLWEWTRIAGYDHVLYYDTDSLWVDQVGYERLSDAIDDHRLGALKVEAVADSIQINAPKDYRFGDVVRHKGVARGAEEIAPGIFKVTQWQGFRGALQNDEVGRVFVTHTVKTLHRKVNKGLLQADGVIIPFTLRDGRRTDLTPYLDFYIQRKRKLPRWVGTLGPDLQAEWWELSERLPGLIEARIFPQTLLFTVWDYREGQIRSGWDSPGHGHTFRGEGLDSEAERRGYPDYQVFLRAIEEQVNLNRQIKSLKARLRAMRPP